MRFGPIPGIVTHRSLGIESIPTYGLAGRNVIKIMVSLRETSVPAGARSMPRRSTVVLKGKRKYADRAKPRRAPINAGGSQAAWRDAAWRTVVGRVAAWTSSGATDEVEAPFGWEIMGARILPPSSHQPSAS
jgi:hypothetical protein